MVTVCPANPLFSRTEIEEGGVVHVPHGVRVVLCRKKWNGGMDQKLESSGCGTRPSCVACLVVWGGMRAFVLGCNYHHIEVVSNRDMASGLLILNHGMGQGPSSFWGSPARVPGGRCFGRSGQIEPTQNY